MNSDGRGNTPMSCERIFEVFLVGINSRNIWARNRSNIHFKQEILVALGCQSLYKAAAAHVNNNAMALGCRRSTEGFMERMKSVDPWMDERQVERKHEMGKEWLSLEGGWSCHWLASRAESRLQFMVWDHTSVSGSASALSEDSSCQICHRSLCQSCHSGLCGTILFSVVEAELLCAALSLPCCRGGCCAVASWGELCELASRWWAL